MQSHERLSTALRDRRIQQGLLALRNRLSSVYECPPEAFTVDTSTNAEERFLLYLQKLSPNCKIYKFRLYIPTRMRPQLHRVVRLLAYVEPVLPMWAYYPVGVDVVAVQLESRKIFERALDLIDLDEADLHASTEDFAYGIALSYYTERLLGASRKVYELTVWGEHFIRSLIPLWKRGIGRIGYGESILI